MSNAGKVARILTAAPLGFEGHLIEVESDLKNGLPSLTIVGLGSKAIDEAKERVRSAIANSDLDFPPKKLVINLAPAELPKDGTHYDLAIALAVLVSSGQLKQQEVNNSLFAGELSLDGQIRPVRGIISIAEVAAAHNPTTRLFIPTGNADQASLVENIEIVPVSSLRELFLVLKGELPAPTHTADSCPSTSASGLASQLDDVIGQTQAKRALVIAAAGHHNILFTGSPGAGKTMLARTLTGLMPPLSSGERVAVTKLHSLAGERIDGAVSDRPFRTPHHTSSRISLVGGGNPPKPGDISLAHHGVLFLDEIPEYPRATLESLRQPLEDRTISISRASGTATYPASFMLVATMNPCPCGFYGDDKRECRCSSTQILAYQQRLSGPLLDRIDLVVTVGRTDNNDMMKHKVEHYTQQNEARNKIDSAYVAQRNRYKSSSKYNSDLSSREITKLFSLSPEIEIMLSRATDQLGLSARGYFKVLKVARTIADLDGEMNVSAAHVAEALQYRTPTP